MTTDIAIPEEPEDKCRECGATFQFHIENPGGVRYVLPKELTAVWSLVEPELDITDAMYDIRTCYVYKLGLN